MKWLHVVLAISVAVGLAAPAHAAPAISPPTAPSAAPVERQPETVAPDELGRGSPRGAVSGFLQATIAHDYARAARYLDLRGRPLAEAAAKGPELARQLRVVLDNTRIDLTGLPDEPDGRREAGMRAGVQTVSRIELDNATVSIQLERVSRDDGLLIWQFSRETLRHVPDLHWKFSYGLVGKWLPPVFVETRLLGLALWQWIGLFVLAGVSLLIAWAVVRPGLPLTRRFLALTRVATADASWGKTVGPLRTLVALAIFRVGQPALSLPVLVQPAVSGAQQILLVLALTWMILRFVAVLSLRARQRAIARGDNPTLIELAQRAARIFVVTMSVLLLLEAVGVQPTAMLAAVGVGGIGIALAAQRTVENLFGGLVVIGDQPIRVGDFCRIGERQGTVERIGLWSTRIRTAERSVVSVPNAQFFTLHVDNLQRRDRLLFNATLRLRYDTTPDQVRAVLTKIREGLAAHPLVDPDPARVRLTGFGTDALEVEVFAYLRTVDYDAFVTAREELCLGFMDIVAAAGTAFALPTRTIQVAGDGRTALATSESPRPA